MIISALCSESSSVLCGEQELRKTEMELKVGVEVGRCSHAQQDRAMWSQNYSGDSVPDQRLDNICWALGADCSEWGGNNPKVYSAVLDLRFAWLLHGHS